MRNAVGIKKCSIQRSIAVEENCPLIDQTRDSHFVAAALRLGCDTSRCHTTAWADSAYGVTCAGFSVGTSTHSSATRPVYPPSRPTIPITRLPTLLAYSSAATRFGLTLFSRLPPPTESTRR